MFFFMLSLGPSSPLGDSDLPYVQCANMMVARVMLLLLLLKFLNCTFVLEQPSGSLFLSCSNWKLSLSILKCAILLKVYFATQRLWTHPRAVLVQSVWKLYSTNFSMGAYNNWCQKPTLLTSNRHWWFEWFKLVSADAKVCVCVWEFGLQLVSNIWQQVLGVLHVQKVHKSLQGKRETAGKA